MVCIREAVTQDAESIALISTDSLGYPCRSELVERRLRELDTCKQKVFVAVEGERVVGFVQAELYQLLYQEDSINVLGLAVSKNYQRNGYGRQLMQAVELWAKQMNCSAVRLNSATGRTEAHIFYERLGYRNTKSQKRFVKDIF